MSRKTKREPRPALCRLSLVGVLFLLIGGAATLADPVDTSTAPPTEIRPKTDRLVGLAPMELQVSATLHDSERRTLDAAPSHRPVLEVRSSQFRVRQGDRTIEMYSGGNASFEAAAGDHADPMVRSLVLNHPGTYTFRFLMEAEDGRTLVSNAVQVRVL